MTDMITIAIQIGATLCIVVGAFTICLFCASIIMERFALVAQQRLKTCDVKRLESGQWIFIFAGVLGADFAPIELAAARRAALPAAVSSRRYEPTSGATHNFAIQMLTDSIKNYGAHSDHICGIRFYPRNDADWRAAVKYLQANWSITSEPTLGTYSTPLYPTVAGLLENVTARRCPSPSPTVIDGEVVVTQSQ